uniref:Late nodulin n=1 Tax=Solanum lycopersicum TaxID=4081 RepID=A0A3Q7I817_SOLLC
MEKAAFLKVFLIFVLLILLGQGSHAKRACSNDADCAKFIRCIDSKPTCDLKKHRCFCPPPPNYETKRVQKSHQN